MPVLAVLIVTQPAGLLIALAVLPLFGADALATGEVLLAFAGGAAAMAGLGAFYTAMAVGTMSVVAPIAALGVVVPVGVGLARGEEPGAVAFAGLAVAIAGVVLLSVEERSGDADPRMARRSIVLALASAIGFGGFFTLLDLASADIDQPGWVIVAARAGGVAADAGGRGGRPPEPRRHPRAVAGAGRDRVLRHHGQQPLRSRNDDGAAARWWPSAARCTRRSRSSSPTSSLGNACGRPRRPVSGWRSPAS